MTDYHEKQWPILSPIFVFLVGGKSFGVTYAYVTTVDNCFFLSNFGRRHSFTVLCLEGFFLSV